MDFKEILLKFLDKEPLTTEETEFLFTEIKKIIYFAIKSFLSNDTTNYKYKLLATEYVCEDSANKIMSCVDEIFPEFFAKIYKEKENIKNIFKNEKESYIKGYLKKIVINNLILDRLKKYPFEKDEKGNITDIFDTESLDKPIYTDSEKTKKESIVAPIDTEIEVILREESNHLIKIIDKNLTNKEKKVLCYDEYQIEKCIKDSSKDAVYKGRERYKKRLKDILIENKISEEIYNYMIEKEILMSEICKKICL